MAYNSNTDYQDIHDDLLEGSLDITQTPLTEDVEHSTVQVTTEINGVPVMRRMAVSTLTAEATSAAQTALTKAGQAETAATLAQTAASNAQSAAQSATTAAQGATTAIDNFQDTMDSYFQSVETEVQEKLLELGQMALSGTMTVTVNSIQLFEDFVQATGFVGTYNDFLILLGQGGGGGSVIVDAAMSTTSVNPVQNKVISSALNGKQDIMESLTTLDIIGLLN